MEPVIIVEARHIVRLGQFEKLWKVGWIVALLAFVATAVQSTRLYEAHQKAKELSTLMAQVKAVQADQTKINETYVQAWNNQQETTNLVVSWAQYIKERQDMSNQNRQNAPALFVANRVK